MSDENERDAQAYAMMLAQVGKPIGAPATGPDPVNQPMIRHWAAAMEDHNPVYVDPAFAAASRFGGIVAPPLMLQTWSMPTPKISGIAERGGSPTEGALNPLSLSDSGRRILWIIGLYRAVSAAMLLGTALLLIAGFIATLATNSEFEILRYLHLGVTVCSETIVESVSEKKQTRLGPGHFITWVTTYRGDRDEVVGRQMFRILKFRPDLEALLK